jgi:hypothetical protein
MQNPIHKILFLFLICLFFNLQTSIAQADTESLRIADSLFQKKKYTESFAIYNEMLETGNKYSPSMLLKMAYIKEGLGSYTEALYYLNLYHKETNNKQALYKINELAQKYNLIGYETSDLDIFQSYFSKYLPYTIFILLGFAGLLTCFTFYLRKYKNQKSLYPAFIQLGLLIALFIISNYNISPKRGMIISSNAYIMNGPSSGAGILEIVGQGHKVKVIDHQDVWTKIEWQDNIGYIKGKNLKLID